MKERLWEMGVWREKGGGVTYSNLVARSNRAYQGPIENKKNDGPFFNLLLCD
jgi:hypothetical protein